MKRALYGLIVLLAVAVTGCNENLSVVAPGAEVQKLASGFEFTEGPVADAHGNVFFTDIPNSRIHKWSPNGSVSTFVDRTGEANGLYFDAKGNLLACQGGARKLASIDASGKVTTLADKYNGKKLNSPNDLWLDPKGGIYFTDPRYGPRDNLEQDGEHVYYLSPDRKKVIRVADDMVRPNGIIGTPDGKKLYIADLGAGRTYVYKINANGTLSDKKLFAPEGSDGMTIDNEANIYFTTDAVKVYDSKGNRKEIIDIPERPANVTFGGKDKHTLFVTARTSLYSIEMRTKGL
jgi:gluconolactonase